MVFLLRLLFVAGPVLWVFNRLKLRYVFSWFWTIFVCAVIWGGWLVLRWRGWAVPALPEPMALLAWGDRPEIVPTLLLDTVSWPFALALSGIGLGVVLTSAQRLADAGETVDDGDSRVTTIRYEDWRNQAAILILMGFGLLGVLAGNPLTMILAWAGADVFGLWVLLIRITGREESERVVLDFSARVTGILLLLWAMAVAWAAGEPFGFDHIPMEVNVIVLLACAFRLGVLPLQVYFFEELQLRRGLGMMVRMVTPAVSSLMLLVRVASTGVSAFWVEPLLAFTALTGVYAGYSWFTARNEMEGRSFWVLGMASLTVVSALRGQPVAAQAWGLALLLGGGGLFLFSARSLWLRGMVGCGALMISALPWMPTAGGALLFSGGFSWSLLVFGVVHALLLAGFVRHVLIQGERGQVSIRAIRGGYTLGLLIMPGTLVLVGWFGGTLRLYETWWTALVGVGLAGGLGVWIWRGGRMPSGKISSIRQVFSFHWLYRLFWRGYRWLGSGVAFVTVLLEGEAGVLWTLLLLFLLISLITVQAGLGG